MKYLSFLALLFFACCTKPDLVNVVEKFRPEIVCDGNSRTMNPAGGYGGGVGYPEYLAEYGYQVKNLGIGGQTIVQMLANADPKVDTLFKPGSILVVWEFSNQVYYWGGEDLAYEKLKEYCTGRKAIGWKIIVCTSPHYDLSWNKNFTTPHGDTWATFNGRLDKVNELIRTEFKDYSDALVDFAADPRFMDEKFSTKSRPDTTGQYYFDGVHFTEIGRRAQAESVKEAIAKLWY